MGRHQEAANKKTPAFSFQLDIRLQNLTQHYLHQEWRSHLITPIYKSGNKSSMKNYLTPLHHF